MPSSPTPSDVHINGALSNVAIDWALNSNRYAFNRVFPLVPVLKQSDSYFVWSQADAFRDEARERGPGAAAPVTVARVSNDSYNCKVYALARRLDDQTLANADSPLNLRMQATRDLAGKIMLRMEMDWIANFFTTGIWTGSTTGADLVGAVDFTKFAAPTTGTPVEVIRAEVFKMATLGIDPATMTLTIGPAVWQVLLDHEDIYNRFENVMPAVMTEDLVAQLLGIGRVIVPYGVRNTAAEGATATNAFVAADNMLLSFAPPAASIMEPSAGYTFLWTGLTGGQGMRTLSMRDDIHHSEHLEVEAALAPKATAPELGVFFSDCI